MNTSRIWYQPGVPESFDVDFKSSHYGNSDRDKRNRWVSLELHIDGAGTYALYVPDLNDHRHLSSADGDETRTRLVDDESVASAILSGILLLTRHARDRTAAGGNVLIRAQPHPYSEHQPLQIGHARRHVVQPRSSTTLAERPEPSEVGANLAEAGPALVTAASRLHDQLGHVFGIPEMGQLDRDGRIRRKYWRRDEVARVESWARTNRIEVTDETIG